MKKTKPYQKSSKPNPRNRRALPDPLADLSAPRRLSDPFSAAKNEPKPAEKYVDKPLTPRQHAKYLRGHAARRQASTLDDTTPLTPLDLMERYGRRYYGGSLSALKDRAWLELYDDCKRAAAALNAWRERRQAKERFYAGKVYLGTD